MLQMADWSVAGSKLRVHREHLDQGMLNIHPYTMQTLKNNKKTLQMYWRVALTLPIKRVQTYHLDVEIADIAKQLQQKHNCLKQDLIKYYKLYK